MPEATCTFRECVDRLLSLVSPGLVAADSLPSSSRPAAALVLGSASQRSEQCSCSRQHRLHAQADFACPVAINCDTRACDFVWQYRLLQDAGTAAEGEGSCARYNYCQSHICCANFDSITVVTVLLSVACISPRAEPGR